MKYKCPVCGNEEFVSSPIPFLIYGDAYFSCSETPCEVCTNCGYVMWFARHIPVQVSERKMKAREIDAEISAVKKEIAELESSKIDLSEQQALLKKMKADLEFYNKAGIDNKASRALKESIKDLEENVPNKLERIKAAKIESLKQKLDTLNKKREQL